MKVVASLTVLVANIGVLVCLVLLAGVLGREGGDQQGESMQYGLALGSALLLCTLVLVTATLDNLSWWASCFPDVFLSRAGLDELLERLWLAEPGCKVREDWTVLWCTVLGQVTIQQEFWGAGAGGREVPHRRQRAIEMFRPRTWQVSCALQTAEHQTV